MLGFFQMSLQLQVITEIPSILAPNAGKMDDHCWMILVERKNMNPMKK